MLPDFLKILKQEMLFNVWDVVELCALVVGGDWNIILSFGNWD